MQRIFISYAHADGSALAELLYQRLRGAGYPVWKDNHSLPLGAPFVKEIAGAIDSHDHVLVLLSAAALASQWVEFETNMAETARRRIIPILVEPLATTTLPLNLQARQMLSMVNADGMALHTLVNALEGATIPRLVNLSGQQQLSTINGLVLAEAPLRMVALDAPEEVTTYGQELAALALPYMRNAGAGVVLPGLAAVAGVTLAHLAGLYNALPTIYVPHRLHSGGFQVDGAKPIHLQDVRDAGFQQRNPQ